MKYEQFIGAILAVICLLNVLVLWLNSPVNIYTGIAAVLNLCGLGVGALLLTDPRKKSSTSSKHPKLH